MTLFETDGFLSEQVLETDTEIAKQYQAAFAIATDANRLTHKLLFEATVHNEDLFELLHITLLTKQARSFQGFMLLLQRGLLAQAQILLRNMAENMFIVGALGKDSTFAARYVAAENIERVKFLKALRRNAQQRGEDVDAPTIELIASIEKRIKDEGIEPIKIVKIAEIAGLSSYYDSLYRFTSLEAHTSPRALQSAFVLKDDRVVSLKYEPDTEKLDMYLHYAISAMLYALHEYAQYFKLPVDAIEALQKTNNKVGEASHEKNAAKNS